MTQPEFSLPARCSNCNYLCTLIAAHYELTDGLANDALQAGMLREREAIESNQPLHEQKSRNAATDLALDKVALITEVLHHTLQSEIDAYSTDCDGTYNSSDPALQPCRNKGSIIE